MAMALPRPEGPSQLAPAELPPPGSPLRWPWLQRLRRVPRLDAEPWLNAVESGDLVPAADLLAVLVPHLDPPAQLRLLRWWRVQLSADPALPARVLTRRDPASAAWLAAQLAPGPSRLGPNLPPLVAEALLPLLGHQRQPQAWSLFVAWLQAPIPARLRRAALEGVALGLPVWPRVALSTTLTSLATDLDSRLAATAVDLLARMAAPRGRLLPLRRCHLDAAVLQRLERRLAATPAQPLLLVVHGRHGGALPAELQQLAVELERRRGAPVRLQALTASEPSPSADLLQLNRCITLVPLFLLPGAHVRHDLPAIVRHWRRLGAVRSVPFLGAWPCWQRALRSELQRLGPEPVVLHHPLEGPLAARYLAHLERVCGARCLPTPYGGERLSQLQLSLESPALPLALAANRLTDQLADRVGPPLLQRPALRSLLLDKLEALP